MNKIVIIEETLILQMRLERLISSLGTFEIIEYTKSSRSFESFYSKHSGVNIVILDLDCCSDKLDEVCEVLKKEESKRPKLIVLSQSVEYELMLKLYSKGVDEVILKPFADDVLLEKLIGLGGSLSIGINKSVTVIDSTNRSLGGKTMLQWCSDFEIGIEIIDKEHKDIIDHFEKLYVLMKEGKGKEYYNDLVKFLKDYVNIHFEHEQKLQKEMNYVNYEEHKKIHDDFKSEVEAFIERTDWHTISNKELLDLNLFLKDWLVNHIMVEDKKIGLFYREHK